MTAWIIIYPLVVVRHIRCKDGRRGRKVMSVSRTTTEEKEDKRHAIFFPSRANPWWRKDREKKRREERWTNPIFILLWIPIPYKECNYRPGIRDEYVRMPLGLSLSLLPSLYYTKYMQVCSFPSRGKHEDAKYILEPQEMIIKGNKTEGREREREGSNPSCRRKTGFSFNQRHGMRM